MLAVPQPPMAMAAITRPGCPHNTLGGHGGRTIPPVGTPCHSRQPAPKRHHSTRISPLCGQQSSRPTPHCGAGWLGPPPCEPEIASKRCRVGWDIPQGQTRWGRLSLPMTHLHHQSLLLDGPAAHWTTHFGGHPDRKTRRGRGGDCRAPGTTRAAGQQLEQRAL